MRLRILLTLLKVVLVGAVPCSLAAGGPPGSALAARAAGAREKPDGVVINEVFYDPAGPDSGGEFIELINTGPTPVSLDGCCLRVGDGAREGAWSTAWNGSAADSVGPGGLFVVAEWNVDGAGAYAQLGMQNGPDGCALVWEGAPLDVVGWGAIEFEEYYEGAPAQDVKSGVSLARVPDGRDTGDNSADFVAASPPTPGRANALARDMGFYGRGIEARPLNPESHEPVSIVARVVSAGIGAGVADGFELRLDAVDLTTGLRSQLCHITSAIAPGDTAVFQERWEPSAEGPFLLEGDIYFEGDQRAENDVATLALRVGPGPLIINEIMYDPLGGGEWLEILNISPHQVDLSGWRIEDKSGGGFEIASEAVISPDGYVVVSQDSAALAGRHLELEASKVVGTFRGRWATLNNSDGPDGVAEIVTLFDDTGMPSDVAVYSERFGGGAGVSLERLRPDLAGHRPDNWFSSVAPGGATPGAGNSAGGERGPGEGVLAVDPAFVYASAGSGAPARISYNLPFRPSELRLSVYSMDGREIALLADRDNGPPRGSLLWNGLGAGGASLPAGVYIVLLTGRSDEGETANAKAVVVVR